VDSPTRAGHLPIAVAAAAHDLNDELTVILSSAAWAIEALGPEHPSRELLLDLQSAAQRCAWKCSTLLNYAMRLGAKPVAAAFESLIEAAADRDGES
jgi:hypothetical protein